MPADTCYDVMVLGAGAAGLFCAAEAGRRGLRVVAIDHSEKLGEKIRISGGGRCNFTNIETHPDRFLSDNPKFAISALRRFTPSDFIARVDAAGITWHEKKLGQLFCDNSAADIITMLMDDCRAQRVRLTHGVPVQSVSHTDGAFCVTTEADTISAKTLVVATGGKSIPKIGATGFGYRIAEQFGLPVKEPRPALVPLIFDGSVKVMAQSLAGVSVDAGVTADPNAYAHRGKTTRKTSFTDGFLFTHRGLSGPSILQISNHWREGGSVVVDFAPGQDLLEALRTRRSEGGRVQIQTVLSELLPNRLARALADEHGWSGNLADWSDKRLGGVAETLHAFRVTPTGSEGYRTAEVTLGGVDTSALNSRTMEAKEVPGLHFIGEVVDVTGWLGGYNFQWAWSSAYAAAHGL